MLTRRKQDTEYRKGLLSARPLLAACVFLMLSLSIEAAVYYVSTDGDDAADGTTTGTAWRTINASINRITAPDSLQIRGGTYREEIIVTNTSGSAETPLVMEAYSNETPVVKGSDIVTDWTYHGNSIWKKTGWTNRPQQVFFDGEYLQMIGWPNSYLATNVFGCSPNDYIYIPYGHSCTEANSKHTIPINGVAELTASSFYYDDSADTLYIYPPSGSSPNDYIVEVSVRTHTFNAPHSAPYIHVKEIDFFHCNTLSITRAGWPSVVSGPHGVFDHCTIAWSDAYGLALKSDARAVNCYIHHNGMAGVNMGNCTNFFISGCTIVSNNFRDFTLGYCGGIKIIPNAGGIVESNEVAWNYCTGVWFDTCHDHHPITVRNNYIHHNAPHANRTGDTTERGCYGIFIEISDHADIYNNIVSSNSFVGISLTGSDNNRVYNNTIIGTTSVVEHARGLYALAVSERIGYNLQSNLVYNNLVYANDCDYDFVMPADNGRNVMGNRADHNLFYRPTQRSLEETDAGIILPNSHLALNCSGKAYSNLSQWATATGWDSNSLASDPDLFHFWLLPTSPGIDAGLILPWMDLHSDYNGDQRIVGNSVDIGAIELGSLHAAFSATPQSSIIPFTSVFHGQAIATNSSAEWYGWDFNGDGILDEQGAHCQIVTNCYTQATPYTVSLVISNQDGVCSTGIQNRFINAHVQDPPEPFWLRAFAMTNSASVRWQNPPQAGISNQFVQVRWSTSEYPLELDDGTLLYTGTNRYCLHTNLTPEVTYYYSIWISHDGNTFINPP